MNAAVVRPLLDHLYDPDDVSMGKYDPPWKRDASRRF